MNDLPSGLAEPLRYFEFDMPWWLVWVAAFLALLWLGQWLGRRQVVAPAPAVSAPRTTVEGTAIEQEILQIRARFDASQDYRGGCHELAATCRRYFSARLQPLATLTAREIDQRFDGRSPAQLFALLDRLQFRRQAPTRGEFVEACNLARTVTARERSRSTA